MPDTGSPPPILGLEVVTAAMVPLVGGKAANLGELLAAGLPVPDGFCLTTEAYREATAGTGARASSQTHSNRPPASPRCSTWTTPNTCSAPASSQ